MKQKCYSKMICELRILRTRKSLTGQLEAEVRTTLYSGLVDTFWVAVGENKDVINIYHSIEIPDREHHPKSRVVVAWETLLDILGFELSKSEGEGGK